MVVGSITSPRKRKLPAKLKDAVEDNNNNNEKATGELQKKKKRATKTKTSTTRGKNNEKKGAVASTTRKKTAASATTTGITNTTLAKKTKANNNKANNNKANNASVDETKSVVDSTSKTEAKTVTPSKDNKTKAKPKAGKLSSSTKKKKNSATATTRKPKVKVTTGSSRTKKSKTVADTNNNNAVVTLLTTTAAKSKEGLPLEPPVSLEKKKKEKLTESLSVLILDSGGWTVKHGNVLLDVEREKKEKEKDNNNNNNDKLLMYSETPNYCAKLRHQITILVGDEIMEKVRNKGQLQLMRPLERGYITDMGTQLKVWSRIIALLGNQNNNNNKMGIKQSPPQCVFLMTQPFTPNTISEQIDEVIFHDLNFGRIIKRMNQCMSSFHYIYSTSGESKSKSKSNSDGTKCCLVIDSGFSMTHVVPTYKSKALSKGIRRINIGGKLLTNLLKEKISYRQWNMDDEFFLVNQVKEDLGLVCSSSKELIHSLKRSRNIRNVKVNYKNRAMGDLNRNFILPDFVHTFEGTVLEDQIEQQLQDHHNIIKQSQPQELDDDDGNHDTDSENDEENNNSITQKDKEKNQLLKFRQQEQLRKQLEIQNQQILQISSVERISIPEPLFSPNQQIGLDQLGLISAIIQSVESCHPKYHAALYNNIVLTGGNVKFEGFKERIENELRENVPSQYNVRVFLPEDPVGYAWKGAELFLQSYHDIDFDDEEEEKEVEGKGKEKIDNDDDYNMFFHPSTCCLDKETWEEYQKSKSAPKKNRRKTNNTNSSADGMVNNYSSLWNFSSIGSANDDEFIVI